MGDAEMVTAEAPQLSDAQEAQFAELHTSKLLEKLRQADKTPEAAARELQDALAKVHVLQQEFVAKQAKHNLLDKLAQTETLEELQRATSARKSRVRADVEQDQRALQQATQERKAALRRLEQLATEVEHKKESVVEHERGRPAFESQLEHLTAEWKALQKRNAQRKAAIQMATSLMINDEEDCGRVLDQQTQSIQELHQRRKDLEDKEIDISTKVKRTTRRIETLSKQNDLRSKDAEVKQREQDYMTLVQMKQWYDRVRLIQTALSGLRITHVAEDFVEVCVLHSHSLRLYCDPESTRLQRVEFLEPRMPASDLVELAVRDNDVQFLLCEYRERVRAAS